nr:hypothetical protein [Tanacetum cinerariifolium]
MCLDEKNYCSYLHVAQVGIVKVKFLSEPSYNQNYDVNYYSHDLPSFSCCDYCGESHENFQCQPDNQNVDFSGSDQIQTPQYHDVQKNSLTNDEFEAYTISNNANMNDLQFKLDNFQKKQQDFQEKFEQMQDNFQNQLWNFIQNFHDGLLIPPPGEEKKPEATTDMELLSTNDIQPLPVQEPPQNSDICQLIREECFVEVPEEQKHNMEKTMFDLVKICHHKQFLCMYDNVEDLIEGALDTKLLSINSINSQHLGKKEQEVKNVEEQQAALAPILSTKEPENSLSMGYEHLSITPETEVTESNAKNLLPITSECEVTLEDKMECVVPIFEIFPDCDNHSDILFDSNNDDLSSDDESFEDIEYVDASVPDLAIEENVVQREEEEVDFEDISQVQDVVLREKLFSITRLISNIESLNDNSTPNRVLNSFESDNSLLDNFSPEFETFCYHSEETRSGNTTHANYSLPEYDSFCFEIEPDQERLINLMKNDIPNNSSNDPLLEEVDLFLFDDSIPPGIENIVDDPEGDIRFLEELPINDSTLSHGSSDSNFEDNPSIPRPPPEPPDVEIDAGEEIPIVMNNKIDFHSFMFDKSNVDDARLKLKLLKDATAVAHAKVKDLLSKGPPQVVSEQFGELLLKKNTFFCTFKHILFSLFMDSLSPQVVSAAKLPILNPNEFDLWKTRIEQYFLMTDYSLWEVILNGDSPVPTRLVEGVAQPVAPTTVEHKLARKNELKAREIPSDEIKVVKRPQDLKFG